jgi:hypothetical protein
MKKFLWIVVAVVLAGSMFASTSREINVTCPICKHEFATIVQGSGTSFGKNLDFKPYGAIIIPWPIPKCPICGFVGNKGSFTQDEIALIESKAMPVELFPNEPAMPSYYYLGREREWVNRDVESIIDAFLSSVWESVGNDEYKSKTNELIARTISYIDKIPSSNKTFNNLQLVKLDLLRRTGKFDDASQVIAAIKDNKDFYKDYIVKIIDLQTELIGKKDIAEHPMPEQEKHQ